MNRYRLCTSMGTLTVKKPWYFEVRYQWSNQNQFTAYRISFCELAPNPLAKAQFQSEGARAVYTSKREHDQYMDSNVRLNLTSLFHCYPAPPSAFPARSSQAAPQQCRPARGARAAELWRLWAGGADREKPRALGASWASLLAVLG